jgi:hypothetical protein
MINESKAQWRWLLRDAFVETDDVARAAEEEPPAARWWDGEPDVDAGQWRWEENSDVEADVSVEMLGKAEMDQMWQSVRQRVRPDSKRISTMEREKEPGYRTRASL